MCESEKLTETLPAQCQLLLVHEALLTLRKACPLPAGVDQFSRLPFSRLHKHFLQLCPLHCLEMVTSEKTSLVETDIVNNSFTFVLRSQ